MTKLMKDGQHPVPIVSDTRWNAILTRDESADGTFWYSVRTTGIYCRPSCPSRAARPEHVALHTSLEEARATGCRPCKRCNPEGSSAAQENSALVEAAVRLIEEHDGIPSLAKLADAAGLSPAHFHRVFKSVTGLTPRGYAAARREQRMRDNLQQSASVTDAIYANGFGSSGRFYDQARQMLGMSPRRYRLGAPQETLTFAVGQTSLGAVLVASSKVGITAILLGDDPDALVRDLEDRFPSAELIGGDSEYERTVALVVGAIDNPQLGLDLPLDVRGTAFQQRVWQALRQVPPGKTTTYAEVAAALGSPQSARAVAAACAANKLAVAIPCHRVIKNDGSLSGYRWGVERKQTLLQREAN